MKLDHRLRDITRHKVPLVIFWHEFRHFLWKEKDKDTVRTCVDCKTRYHIPPPLCTNCFQVVCDKCWKAHAVSHDPGPVLSIGGKVLKESKVKPKASDGLLF